MDYGLLITKVNVFHFVIQCFPINSQSLGGFTLIEILIALMVFAILATITSSALYNSFNTKARIETQASRLEALQMALSIIQQDTLQIIQRPIRVNEMRLHPAFVGEGKYVEFTKDGTINPQSLEKRSTLERVALLCEKGQLIRRTWEALDSVDLKTYQDKILLDELTACNFNYLNQTSQMLPEWREQALTPNQTQEPFPLAIQVNITLKDWGEMRLLFTIPGAFYV